ncbi:phage portal protein [Intestinimonas butyriciproducens]|uniref:HK97 family phage portal protein n=1 Tax=Intestinimonas butyriciproducens TaxID=1297617 RepID=A0A2U1BC10_9FIRM|nr:phage portal protein [Intestinimonas butyriciproducens]MCR1907061.1 phage portal protein [Intestinimonas butyriciproducens]PVY46192.1 HK97 family phage portal protein [Intestinimonas butyriciproducens]QBB65396.1 Phage portal protein [Intestinimonas butyriciproducens]
MSIAQGIRVLARVPTRRKAVTAESMIAAGYPPMGTDTNESLARKLSAVDRCIEILSDSMGKLPSFIMDSRTRERVDLPLLQLLNVRPNAAMSPFVAKKVVETSRLVTGNGYEWILRSPRTGRITEIIPVPGELVEPWRDQSGRVWYTVTHPWTGEPMRLPQEDICHYKAASRDGLKGVGVLRRASEVIASSLAAQQYERAYYENGGQPSGVLRTESDLGGYAEDPEGKPLTRSDGSWITRKDQLRSEWEKVHAGPNNSHRVAILDFGLDYKPLSVSNQDAQFIESREVSVRDIARYFGVPLYKLQEGKQAYGSNEQNAIEYVVGTLHPNVSQYEEERTWKLLTRSQVDAGLEVRINMMAELRGDTSARGQWYKDMMQEGPFSVNDVRALEDMPDVPGGDERRASLNYVPLRDWPELSRIRAETGRRES